MNPMKTIRIEKVTLNVGAGKDQKKLDRGMKLLKLLTGIDAVKTVTMKRIPSWGLRPNLPIGCKITIRKDTKEFLKRLLSAKDFRLKDSVFDEKGNISFGVQEYIDVQGIEYNHDVGMMGFEVSVTLERPGYRVKRRATSPRRVGKNHAITKQDAIEYFRKEFDIKLGEEE